MNLNEFNSFSLHDAVHFHEELNPELFQGDKLIPEVREQLLLIAEDFMIHLGINDVDIEDVTLSGSNAAYSYTKHSDIDLHILVDMSKFNDDPVYREFFDAKKTIYNDTHSITIGGIDVELYVQDTNEPVISLGEYSILRDSWIKLPRKRKAHISQVATKNKYRKLYKLSEFAFRSNNPDKIKNVVKTIKKYRQAGLDKGGEFSPENLAFKILRSKGIIKKLYDKLQSLHDKRLSLPESVDTQTLDPDFKHSMKFDGLTYVATGTFGENQYTSKGYDWGDDIPGLRIEVFDGKVLIAFAFFIQHKNDVDSWLESDYTKVSEYYRGRNIAYQMYAYAKMLGNDIRKSTDREGNLLQTAKGKKMWKGWGKKDYKHLTGVNEVVNPKIFNDITNSLPMFGTKPVRIGDFMFDARTFIGTVGNSDAQGLQIRAYDPKLPKGSGSIGSADFVVHSDKKDKWLESADTEVKDEDRKLILQSLFSRAETGLPHLRP